jgi:hypothetical protein
VEGIKEEPGRTPTPLIMVALWVPSEECQSAGKEFAAYFTPEYKDGKLYCVTPCMSGFNTSLDCHYGKCQLQRSGPQCL